jgi:predicted ATPase
LITPALAETRATGATLWAPYYLLHSARAYVDLGQFQEASREIAEAMAAAEKAREKWCDAELQRMAGEIVLLSPEANQCEAKAHFERALGIARKQQAKSWELRAAMSMARLWRDQAKRREARELLASVYGWFTEGFDTLDLKQAKTLLNELAQ